MATPLSVEGQWRPHCQWKVNGDPTVSGRSVATPLSVEGQWRPHCQWKVSGNTTVSGRSVATPLSVEGQWRHHLLVEGQWRPHCQWKVSGDTTVSGRSVATPLSVAGPPRGCRTSCSLILVVSTQLSGDTTVGTWTHSGCRTPCTEYTLVVNTAQWRGDFALKTSCLLV